MGAKGIEPKNMTRENVISEARAHVASHLPKTSENDCFAI